MTVGPGHFAVVSALVFCIGLGGVMTRRQALMQLMALMVMFAAPVIAVAGFSQTQASPPGANTGVAVGLVMLAAFTAELGIGVSVLILLLRRSHSLDLDSVEHLEG